MAHGNSNMRKLASAPFPVYGVSTVFMMVRQARVAQYGDLLFHWATERVGNWK